MGLVRVLEVCVGLIYKFLVKGIGWNYLRVYYRIIFIGLREIDILEVE